MYREIGFPPAVFAEALKEILGVFTLDVLEFGHLPSLVVLSVFFLIHPVTPTYNVLRMPLIVLSIFTIFFLYNFCNKFHKIQSKLTGGVGSTSGICKFTLLFQFHPAFQCRLNNGLQQAVRHQTLISWIGTDQGVKSVHDFSTLESFPHTILVNIHNI